jgi:hypothetical protein
MPQSVHGIAFAAASIARPSILRRFVYSRDGCGLRLYLLTIACLFLAR